MTCQGLCSSQNCSRLNLGITLTSDLAESTFTVSVTAINDLGNSSSFPFTFTFLDIGKFAVSQVCLLAREKYLKAHSNLLCVVVLKETGADGKQPMGTDKVRGFFDACERRTGLWPCRGSCRMGPSTSFS